MNEFLIAVANGLSNGVIFAMLALALVTVFRTTGHLNFAQGELAVLSAFLVLVSIKMGLPIWLAIIAAMIVSAVLSAGIQLIVVGPLARRGKNIALIALLGVFLFVNAFNGAVFGVDNMAPLQPFPGGVDDRILILNGNPPFYLSYAMIGALGTLIILMGLWWILLNRTRLGLTYRAVISNQQSASLVGIRVNGIFMLGWALAAIPGTFAGVFASQLVGTLGYTMMINILIYGFTAACLGGFDSPGGAVAGGLIVGLADSMIPYSFPAISADSGLVVALVLLLVVLLVRPQGLFGKKLVKRV